MMRENLKIAGAIACIVLLIVGFVSFVYYLQDARHERQAHRIEMLGIARDVILDSLKNEQECREKLKEAKANRHPYSEFWDAPYQKGGGG